MRIDVSRMDDQTKKVLKEVIEEAGGADLVQREYMSQKELIEER